MELLRIEAHQVMANYRKPMSYGFVDSYPLPSISTIRGWFHAVIGASEYIPIKMSIQGKSSSVVYDLQRMIKLDRDVIMGVNKLDFSTFNSKIVGKIANDYDKEFIKSIFSKDSEKEKYVRNKLIKDQEKRFKNIMISIDYPKPYLESFAKLLSYSPTYVANIFEIDLTIYIQTDKEHLDSFKDKLFSYDYPHIGRNEDLACIDSISYVEVKEKGFGVRNNHSIDYGIYLKRETALALSLSGLNYRMPFKYEVINGIRYFKRLDVVYVEDGAINKSCLFDEEKKKVIDLVGDYNDGT